MAGRKRNACQAQKETIDVDKAWASHVDTIDNKQMRQHGRAQDESNSGDKLASIKPLSEVASMMWMIHILGLPLEGRCWTSFRCRMSHM